MSAPLKTMSTIKQVLRLNMLGKSNKGIAKTTGLSKNTVKKYLQLAHSMAIDLPALMEMEDALLEQQFVTRNHGEEQRYEELEALFPGMIQELGVKPGVTRWVLWGEYRAKHKGGYGYSQFCYYLQQHMHKKAATMHIEHHPGESMYVDFTGKKLHIVDQETGDIQAVEVFVALLGYSQYAYVEAIRSQKMEDFITAVENALFYFQGCPKLIVSDNLKSAVTKASRYEPELNDTFLDFSNHYNMGSDPTRPYKPKDKPLVENAVKIVYSRVFAALRNKTFFRLPELNVAIKECIDKHNRTPFQGFTESRYDRYETTERATLHALPQNRFEIKTIRELTVQQNCYIEIRQDRHYYSAPHRYIGKHIRVIYTQTSVSIYFKGDRVAFHVRDFKPGYTTIPEHLTSTHAFFLSWSPEKFTNWGTDIGVEVGDYIKKVIESKPFPEQAYKSCLGILSLAKKDSRENLIKACKRASDIGVYNYVIIKTILQNKAHLHIEDDLEESNQYKLPLHENIRGASSYQ
jgi:transposase